MSVSAQIDSHLALTLSTTILARQMHVPALLSDSNLVMEVAGSSQSVGPVCEFVRKSLFLEKNDSLRLFLAVGGVPGAGLVTKFSTCNTCARSVFGF